MRAERLAPLALAVLLFAACGGGEQAAPTTSVPAGQAPTTTSSPTTTKKSKPKPKPKAPLEDGRFFGYIHDATLTSEPQELVFDLAYFYTGEEANKVAAERGEETPVPNDVFIVNDNPKLRTLAVSPDVEIDLVDWKQCCEKRFEGDPARFEAAFERTEPPLGRYKGRFTAYWLTVEDGVVTKIEEQYLP